MANKIGSIGFFSNSISSKGFYSDKKDENKKEEVAYMGPSVGSVLNGSSKQNQPGTTSGFLA